MSCLYVLLICLAYMSQAIGWWCRTAPPALAADLESLEILFACAQGGASDAAGDGEEDRGEQGVLRRGAVAGGGGGGGGGGASMGAEAVVGMFPLPALELFLSAFTRRMGIKAQGLRRQQQVGADDAAAPDDVVANADAIGTCAALGVMRNVWESMCCASVSVKLGIDAAGGVAELVDAEMQRLKAVLLSEDRLPPTAPNAPEQRLGTSALDTTNVPSASNARHPADGEGGASCEDQDDEDDEEVHLLLDGLMPLLQRLIYLGMTGPPPAHLTKPPAHLMAYHNLTMMASPTLTTPHQVPAPAPPSPSPSPAPDPSANTSAQPSVHRTQHLIHHTPAASTAATRTQPSVTSTQPSVTSTQPSVLASVLAGALLQHAHAAVAARQSVAARRMCQRAQRLCPLESLPPSQRTLVCDSLTPNPKPQTPNPIPQTLNPTSQTLKPPHAALFRVWLRALECHMNHMIL
jgi:hypothetical protein